MAIPTFSIILPTHNRASLLSEAVQSVLNQEYRDFELVIIDDGSEDNTASVVNSFEDHRIEYYFQKNKGKGSARNEGLARSNGKYICFLDDDDLYKANHLSTFHNYILSKINKSDILRTGVISEVNGAKFESQNYDGKSITDQIDFVLSRYFCLLDLCIPRDIATSFTFPNYRLWQDKYYILLILSKYFLDQIPARTVFAREHFDRSVNKAYKDLSIIKEQILALHTLRNEIDMESNTLQTSFDRAEQQILSTHIYHALEYGGFKDGLKISRKFISDKNFNISLIKILKTFLKYYI